MKPLQRPKLAPKGGFTPTERLKLTARFPLQAAPSGKPGATPNPQQFASSPGKAFNEVSYGPVGGVFEQGQGAAPPFRIVLQSVIYPAYFGEVSSEGAAEITGSASEVTGQVDLEAANEESTQVFGEAYLDVSLQGLQEYLFTEASAVSWGSSSLAVVTQGLLQASFAEESNVAFGSASLTTVIQALSTLSAGEVSAVSLGAIQATTTIQTLQTQPFSESSGVSLGSLTLTGSVT
jgi:hypothetical protein